MSKSVRMLKQEGFTLVELMIVVAIIGILAAIAIPNYQKYQAKARQSEAKIALTAIYTAEQAFQGEKSSYSSCLSNIGYMPDGASRFYFVGFNSGAAAALNCTNGLQCNAVNWLPAVQGCTDNAGAAFGVGAPLFGAVNTTAPNGFAATQRVGTGVTAASTVNTVLAALGAAPGAVPINNPGGTWVAVNQFVVGAVGSIANMAINDTWYMDHTKNLRNPIIGF